MKVKDVFKRLILIVVGVILVIYAISTFAKQQKLLYTYSVSAKDLDNQIEEAQNKNDELTNTKANVDSDEYIEKIAREKLGMYYPNEKVYIDSEQ